MMDENIVREVLSYLIEPEIKSFAYVNYYYFDCICKAGFRHVILTKQNNIIYYLIYQDFRDYVNRLIRSPLKQLSFHSFNETRVIQTVIDAVTDNRYLPHAWEGFGLAPPSLPLSNFATALPEARSLQFCSIVTTDLIFQRFLQTAIKKVTNLSIYPDYTSSQCFLTEIFSFLEAERGTLGLQSLSLCGFSDSIYTLPYISTLKQLVIKLSSMTFDPKYEEKDHKFDSILCEVNSALREFKLQNVRSLKLHHIPIEDISIIYKITDVDISFCPNIKYFPVVFPPSENMTLLGRKLFVDVTTTTMLSLFCDGFDRLNSSFRSNSPKELRKLSFTGLINFSEPEVIFLDQSSVVCYKRDYRGKVCHSKQVNINHFQLSSITPISIHQQFDERRYFQILSAEGEQHLDSFQNLSKIPVNILFADFYGQR